MDEELLKYQIALTMLPNVGDVLAKQLVSYCGGVREVFSSSEGRLKKTPGIGDKLARLIGGFNDMGRVEEEITFIKKNNIQPIFFTDEAYPWRLKMCYDSPVLLYYKGNADLNAQKVISIIGTRKATSYGKEVCSQLVEALAPYNVLITSGLAYGIDVHAHREALKHGLNTVGIFGHGLDRVYPAQHRSTAGKMVQQGGLLSDFRSNAKFDRENFPKRNRIIAGIADATIVIETMRKGGSMITAEIANSYNKDVFAVPGNINATCSEGCNFLIRTNRAHLLDSPEELIAAMGWEDKPQSSSRQKELFIELNAQEQELVDLLRTYHQLPVDELSVKATLTSSQIAANMLNLELKGIVRTLPGKIYQLC